MSVTGIGGRASHELTSTLNFYRGLGAGLDAGEGRGELGNEADGWAGGVSRDLILGRRCTIRAQLISATRGRASQPKVSAMATDCSVTCQQG